MAWNVERRLCGLRYPADAIYAYLTNPDNTQEALGHPFRSARRIDRDGQAQEARKNGMKEGERYECRCEFRLPGLSHVGGTIEFEVVHARPPNEVGIQLRKITDLRVKLRFAEVVHSIQQPVHAEAMWEIREQEVDDGTRETYLVLRTRGNPRGVPLIERVLDQTFVDSYARRMLLHLGEAINRAASQAVG